MTYRHVDRVPLRWAALFTAPFLLAVALPLLFGAPSKTLFWSAPWLLLVLAVVLAFTSLTTTVAGGQLVTAFRFGRPRKRIALTDVAAHRTTTHGARYGWGIRMVPGGTLWRVWGRRSVELTLRDRKRTVSIGTSDPEGLEAAIASAPRITPPFEL